jgi:TetR/AcrR family transcriptional regulator, transcriptional repressor for nem operon
MIRLTRPSRHTDEQLIQAALALLPTTGYTRLSMRAVAAKAGVNLGMFHYHFKNKEEFTRRVANEFYETFFKKFTLEVETGKNPKEQLRKAILTAIRFVRDHRRLFFALGRDMLEGDATIVRLLEDLLPRHGVIIVRLIRECKRQGLIANLPLPIIITFILGIVAGPVLLMTVIERAKLHQPLDLIKKIALPFMVTDRIIEQRLDLAFHAMGPGAPWQPSGQEVDRKIEDILVAAEAKNRRIPGAQEAGTRRVRASRSNPNRKAGGVRK